MARKRASAAHASDGSALPAVAWDLANADQLNITANSVPQEAALDAALVLAMATGGDARVTWGDPADNPTASVGAGSITISSGMWFAIVKNEGDIIAVKGVNGSVAGAVDLIPALAAASSQS